MAINANDPVHILLIGPPASAKTVFVNFNKTTKYLLYRWW